MLALYQERSRDDSLHLWRQQGRSKSPKDDDELKSSPSKWESFPTGFHWMGIILEPSRDLSAHLLRDCSLSEPLAEELQRVNFNQRGGGGGSGRLRLCIRLNEAERETERERDFIYSDEGNKWAVLSPSCCTPPPSTCFHLNFYFLHQRAFSFIRL